MSSVSFGTGVGSGAGNSNKEPIVPRRLDLSVNPVDGSLLTAPLTQVLLSATDGLYTDLYNMAHGELDVATAAQQGDDEGEGGEKESQDHAVFQQLTKRERMSNLSFAQRRHELQWRLFQHGKSLQQVAALTAAHASSDLSQSVRVASQALQHARTAWMQADEAQDALYFFHAQLFPSRQAPHDVYGAADILLSKAWLDLPHDLRLLVDRYQTSPEALWTKGEVDAQWQMAVRNKMVRGEVGWMKTQQYTNLQLSKQQQQSKRRSVAMKKPLFDLSLRGGILKLTHGKPKLVQQQNKQQSEAAVSNDTVTSEYKYPIECLLTVLSSASAATEAAAAASKAAASSLSTSAKTTSQTKAVIVSTALPEWTLLSVEIRVEAKTGEFNHQLETSRRQRYDLHRLAALAMAREEARVRRLVQEKETEEAEQELTNDDDRKPSASVNNDSIPPARPLQALFTVAHTFLLSWQLELLSAQAQALRRGVWAASATNPIHVTPVKFFNERATTTTTVASSPVLKRKTANMTVEDDVDDSDYNEDELNHMLGVLSVSFWKVDDSYGPPSMGDLILDDDRSDTDQSKLRKSDDERARKQYASVTNQLTLSIRAEADVGIRVSLSGAARILEQAQQEPHLKQTAQAILNATCHPLALSVSDALLAATHLCSELKCHAVANALRTTKFQQPDGKIVPVLPRWIYITVERGSIAVAARVQYHYGDMNSPSSNDDPDSCQGMPVLFRLVCDSRTGSFVHTFPRQVELLRQLACNSTQASNAMALRIASLPVNRRRAAGAHSTGRHIRDSFEGLVRSLNMLGQRTGVGGSWDDIDDKSASLRERAIQSSCADVRVSLMKCCGLATLFGLTPLAIGTALGLDASADMAGEVLTSLDGVNLLPVPPISVLLDQQLVETSTTTSDGISKKTSYLSQYLFGAACSATYEGLTLYPLDIRIRLDSPSTAPFRINCTKTVFRSTSIQKGEINGHDGSQPAAKRQKLTNGNKASQWAEDIMEEAGRFARILAITIDPPPDSKAR